MNKSLIQRKRKTWKTHTHCHADVSLLHPQAEPQITHTKTHGIRWPGKLKYEVHKKKYKVRQKPGGHSPMAPPGPIPNPEVKHWSVDGSRTIGPARVDRRQG